jgi:hypothetical protein
MITSATPSSGISRFLRSAAFALLALVASATLNAQDFRSVGNQFIQANADVTGNSGRFWITSGATKFLFQSGNYITSNVVFKITRDGMDQYYCNMPPGHVVGFRPQVPGSSNYAMFAPYDSLYTSTDTMALIWKNVGGFKIIMRFFVEKPTTIYDTGGDILIEFDYGPASLGGNGSIGFFLMLDTYNSEAQGTGGSGDRSSVLTSAQYLPVDNIGRTFVSPLDSMPYFYEVGNFKYELSGPPKPSLNTTLAIHRLRGFSHGGIPLSSPNAFAVGSWRDFRNLAWDFNADIGTKNIGDCATILRWDTDQYGQPLTKGKVRTAFGSTDQGGNNHFTCRDSTMFINIKTVRVVDQKVKNGPYTPSQFDVEMWVTNTNQVNGINPIIRLVSPIVSLPNRTGRVTLDPSTPAVVPMQLAARETKKIVWKLNVNPGSADTVVQLDFRHTLPARVERPFKEGCTPLITIKGYQDPTPPDDRPPVISRGPSGRAATIFWNFSTFDRHAGFLYDTGLDTTRLTIVANQGNNITLKRTPVLRTQCDVNETINLLAEVVDTTRPAKLVFEVADCRGNLTRDSVDYSPRPDIFTPEITRIDTLPNPSYGCNAREYHVFLRDSVNQKPTAGDNGFGLVETIGVPDNFDFRANFDRAALKDFDYSASFRIAVMDTMRDGSITIRFADYAGNADTVTFNYCTKPDVEKPQATVTALPDGRTWQIDVADTLGWDRGLLEVVQVSNLNNNFLFTPPAIAPGDPTASFQVSVIDDSKDGDIVLEVRDTYHPAAGHSQTVHIPFGKVPDTMAPNIVYTIVPGTGRSKFDVEVNDIHPNYPYDLGLATITAVTLTPNMRFALPISFNVSDKKTTFRVEIIDTLAIGVGDTICIQAVDLAGNTSADCQPYPLRPDTLPPLFTGQLSADRTKITGLASDRRDYDRGLGSVVLENPVNLDPSFSMTGLAGAASAPVSLQVLDPNRPVSGTLVIRDLIGEGDAAVADKHLVRIPFWLATAGLALKLPLYVEGNAEFTIAVVATDSFPESQISTIDYDVKYAGNIRFVRATGVRSQLSTLLSKLSAPSSGGLKLHAVMNPGETYLPGDTLGLLDFYAEQQSATGEMMVEIDQASILANDGLTRVIAIASSAAGDTAMSRLVLPPPFVRIAADSLGYINGSCGRILFTLTGGGKRAGLAILALRPQPMVAGGGTILELDVRNLPGDGARGELVALDGRHVADIALPSGSDDYVSLVQVSLPPDLPAGVYFLRVRGATGIDNAKVIVVE